MDGSLILALVSTVAVVLNGIGLQVIWMKYKELAHESLILASEVIGTLHNEDGDNPSPDLAAGALLIISQISSRV